MTGRVAALVIGSLAFWVVAAYPAYRMWGEPALAYSAVAIGLCLLPTLATLCWAGWAAKKSGEQQLVMVLGGTGIRMGVVLAIGLILFYNVPYFQEQSFWIWLLVCYLFTLALEMVLIVRSIPGGVQK